MKFILKYLLLSILISSCKITDIPKQRLFQVQTSTGMVFKNDTIYVTLNNPVKCPMRYYLNSTDSVFSKKLRQYQPVTLRAQTDSIVKIAAGSTDFPSVTITAHLGDSNKTVSVKPVSLPFSANKTYTIVQGYNGGYSHNTDLSRYSLDFNLQKNDTICAADDGFVVGLIKDYVHGGADKKWNGYDNFITVYHPQTGIFTSYAHLVHNGTLVNIGDSVKRGQPIALAGMTGWTDVPHLHFVAKVPTEGTEVMQSVTINFIEGYTGSSLKRGSVVKK